MHVMAVLYLRQADSRLYITLNPPSLAPPPLPVLPVQSLCSEQHLLERKWTSRVASGYRGT